MPPARLRIVVAMALVQASALLASGSKTTHLTMLVNWVDDPVDAWVTADGLVLGIDEDDLVVLVGAVLVDPVAVQDTKIGAAATDTLFGGGFERALVFELIHTLVDRLAYRKLSALRALVNCIAFVHTECGTLWHRPLSSTSSHADAVDDITLLGLISQTTSLVGARWFRSAVNDVQLTELN